MHNIPFQICKFSWDLNALAIAQDLFKLIEN